MTDLTVETINISPTLRVRIEYDRDPDSPANWDNVGEIAYTSTRHTLGTQEVSRDRMDEIAQGIRSGKLIGLPVYAYVHSGSMIAAGKRLKGTSGKFVFCNPFSCPWDSGQSGFVYTTREKAIREFGKKIMTNKVKQATLQCLAGEVETFSQYLEGDVYGYIVERTELDEDGDPGEWEGLESCWGYYGIEYARAEGKSVAEHWAAEEAQPA